MRIVCVLGCLAVMASCTSGPSKVTPPDIDPAAAANAAIDQYDANGDQALSAGEIEDSALSLELWDGDKNGSLSQAEIEQRLRKYVEYGAGMSGVACYVRFNNQPLADAKVTFKPEEFLGGAIRPAYGTTGSDGTAVMALAEEFRPRPELEVLQVGLYTVEITHPQIKVREVTPAGFELATWEEFVNPTFIVRQ